MRPRSCRLLASIATSLLTFAALVPVVNASASVTTKTPVMGPSLLSAKQLATWYARHHGSVQPLIPVFHNDISKLAQVFIDDGKAEGVRGDIAFVQSMLETGWIGFVGSQVPPDAYNYAGIHAYDGRAGLPNCTHGDTPPNLPSRCMGTPQHGVLAQIQLLRSYADASTKTLAGRLISAPSDRVGAAPLWEYFGGSTCPCHKLIWASADTYGVRIIQMYSQALAESGLAGACVPYAPASPGPTSGTGYWEVTQDGRVHPEGNARFLGDATAYHLAAPLVGGASVSAGNGYWLLGRDGGIFGYGSAKFYGSTGAMHLNKPVNGMERTADDKGYWLVADDGGIFGYGDAHFYGSAGTVPLASPILGMERSATGQGYWLFASDGGVFGYGDAQFYGSLGADHLKSPVVAMQRTSSGHGYWIMSADGRVYRFGDAVLYGDIAGCTIYGGATRLLVTLDGKGYWIATRTGAVIAFGSAKQLGFPTAIGGAPVGLLGADPSSFTYSAHYNDAQYAFLVRTAVHFHLAVQDVPKTGVAEIASHLRISRHPALRPIGPIHNRGPHVIVTTYDAATNTDMIVPVERHYVTTGDNALYLGGLLMEYFAALQGVA